MATGQLANLRRPHLGEGPGSGHQPAPQGPKFARGSAPRIDAKGTPMRGGAVFRKAARQAPATAIAHAPGSRMQAKGTMTREAPAPRTGAGTRETSTATGQLANLRRAHLGEGAGTGHQPKPTGGQAPVSVGGRGGDAAPRALERAESKTFRKAGAPPRAPRTVLRDLPPRPAIPREKPREGAVSTMAYSSEEPPAYERGSIFRSAPPDVDQWPHGEMVDMAKSPDEIREDVEKMAAPITPAPQYPYGLSICLTNDELEKLGFNGEAPAVGDILEFFAAAKVTCASLKTDPISGEECLRIEMQICEMAVHEEEPEEVEEAEIEEARSRDRRQRFYGGNGEEMRDYDDDED